MIKPIQFISSQAWNITTLSVRGMSKEKKYQELGLETQSVRGTSKEKKYQELGLENLQQR